MKTSLTIFAETYSLPFLHLSAIYIRENLTVIIIVWVTIVDRDAHKKMVRPSDLGAMAFGLWTIYGWEVLYIVYKWFRRREATTFGLTVYCVYVKKERGRGEGIGHILVVIRKFHMLTWIWVSNERNRMKFPCNLFVQLDEMTNYILYSEEGLLKISDQSRGVQGTAESYCENSNECGLIVWFIFSR